MFRRGGGAAIENFAKLLRILDVDAGKFFPITRPTKFRNIILPDGSFFYSDKFKRRMFTQEYIETIDQIRDFAFKHRQPISQKKFYFFYGRRGSIGEERIAQYFQSKGYAIIQPESFSLEEQLNIFANCESLASTIGSNAHNILFMKDGLDAVLIPRAGYFTGFQEPLNEVHEQNMFYIDSTISIFTAKNKWEGPFCYIISENLRKHFGDEIKEKYSEEDLVSFLSYIKIAKMRDLKENPKEMEYLKNILPEFMEQLKKRTDLLKKFGITFQ